ncbi:BREX system serine/threonine kinase PglW [Amycolatopsis sp. lyj-108]|uniref:BREX system serine/threonine kinase PglW n=1 Tax=Amycolatopsis sp. lyj-108 TaxID=2789286 RepID=UPI003979180A
MTPGANSGSSSVRWYQRKQSDYAWEQEGLDFIKRQMPDAEPYRAWATFSFTAASSRSNECDLLIAVPSGLYLLELKAHPGRVVNHGSTWRFTDRHSGRVRTLPNPLEMTNLKAKELRGQLTRAAQKVGYTGRVPWIEPIVFLTDAGLRSELDEFQTPNVYARHANSGLPAVWDDLLARPPHREADRIRPEFASRVLPQLMTAIGILPATAHLRYGDFWKLDPKALDAGPFWEDRLVRRDDGQLDEQGRLRIYLISSGTSKADAEKAHRAAKREYQVLQGIDHRGIAQARQFGEHQGRPAILFRHHESDLRLDAYLATFSDSLTSETRLGLVRQLAEALKYAHDRMLYHRALSPRSIYVSCRPDGSNPVLRLIDWQTAARDFETTSLRSIGDSSLDGAFIEDTALRYLAPEAEHQYPDPVDMDIFSLGSVSYLILTSRPPASSRSELVERVGTDGGLQVSAVDDTLPSELGDLIYDASRSDVVLRLDSAAAFLDRLDDAEEDATPTPAGRSFVDPLEAIAGQEVDEEWFVRRVLGTGATARALQVERLRETDDGAVVDERVFKVALDEDSRAARLHDEAEALRKVTGGTIVQLLDGPRLIGGHTALELELAGEVSLAKHLREEGRLSYHDLDNFGRELILAMYQLEAAEIHHRDIKPDNLGIHHRANRSRQLKLFDFSLAKASPTDTVGTRGYIDPFVHTTRRQFYDDHAERYAAAVTLYEMATGERPQWGEGVNAPTVTQDETPQIEGHLFDDRLRDGLTAFFKRALHRDIAHRFTSLREMDDLWRSVFTEADKARPATTQETVRNTAADRSDIEVLDRAAEAAKLTTPLSAAGLSSRAASVADGLGATTVGELLDIPASTITRARGAGALTRRELTRRHRQWSAKLRTDTGATDGPASEKLAVPVDVERQSVELLLERLLTKPKPNSKDKGPNVERLTLGLPRVDGSVADISAWPVQRLVADAVGLTQPSVSTKYISSLRKWQTFDWMDTIRREVVEILGDLGRIATAPEVAAEFLARHGSTENDPVIALRNASAIIRAAVDTELLLPGKDEPERSEPALAVLRRNERVLLAAESLDGSDDPSPNELGDYAIALGQAADGISKRDPLPSSATALRELHAVERPEGMSPLADTRLLSLAASMSAHSAASRRLELYPLDLGLVRGLRISQAAAGVSDDGITLDALLAKVRVRFPEISLGTPSPIDVGEALRDAGSSLTFDPVKNRFCPPRPAESLRPARSSSRTLTSIDHAALNTGRSSSELITARLVDGRRLGGFLALKVKAKNLPGAATLVASEHDVEAVDLGRLFLTELRALVKERNQGWDRVLVADTRVGRDGTVPPGLASYVSVSWQRVQNRLMATMAEAGPRSVLFLHDAGLIGRYFDAGGHKILTELQRAARDPQATPHGLWLLCPMETAGEAPSLAGQIVGTEGDHEVLLLRSKYLNELHKGEVA